MAFMLGTTLFFTLCVKSRPLGFWRAVTGMILCFLAIAAVSVRSGVYTTLQAFSSGGYNFPILPHLEVFPILGLYLIAACVVYLGFQRKQTESLTFYLLCISFFALPSGFGRADNGHLLTAAFSAILIATLALSRYPKVLFVLLLYFAVPPMLHVIFPTAGQVVSYCFDPSKSPGVCYRTTERVLHRLHCDAINKRIDAKIAQHFEKIRNAHQLGQIADPPFQGGSIVNAPWGTRWHNMERPSRMVDSGYFPSTIDLILPSQVDSIIRELKAHPERKLLLPRDEHMWPFSPQRCYAYDEGDNPAFSTLYGHHWASPKRQMQVLFHSATM